MAHRIWLQRKRLYALVDDEDAERVAKYDWCVAVGVNTSYAFTADKRIGRNYRSLHRFITSSPVGSIVDHKSGNGLDNRRQNLRIVTPLENSWNMWVMKPENGKSSHFKGVQLFSNGKWGAGITVRGEGHFLGQYDLEEDAARAYDEAALKYFGEYARTNAMMGLYAVQQTTVRNPRFKTASGPCALTPMQRETGVDWTGRPISKLAIRRQRLNRAAKREAEKQKTFAGKSRVYTYDWS